MTDLRVEPSIQGRAETERVALRFFRAWPDSLTSNPGLHSSLQSIETAFLLIASKRFPHALVNCASAAESALKGVPGFGGGRSENAEKLYRRAMAALPPGEMGDVHAFRQARNQYVHQGFASGANEVAAKLLLETGIPFLQACYAHFYQFDLMGSLEEELGTQLRLALDVFQLSRNIARQTFSYCFSAFGHLIRWSARQADMASWEQEVSIHADETGEKDEICRREAEDLEHLFGTSWKFDCPICRGFEIFVCELDETSLNAGAIVLDRAACPSCRFMVRKDSPFLAGALCHTQVAAESATILREYGIFSG